VTAGAAIGRVARGWPEACEGSYDLAVTIRTKPTGGQWVKQSNTILHWGVRALLVVWACALASVARGQSAPAASAGPVSPEDAHPARATLRCDVSRIAPGQAFDVGVLIDLDPLWHTYWLNPGESGSPAKITWNLPQGFEAGEIQWPLPMQFSKPGEPVGYGYEKQVLLRVQIKPPVNLTLREVDLRASVRWLVCDANVCLPGQATLKKTLPVGRSSEPASAQEVATLAAWKEKLPAIGYLAVAKPDSPAGGIYAIYPASADVMLLRHDFVRDVRSSDAAGKTVKTTLEILWSKPAQAVEFFPAPPAGVETLSIRVERDAAAIELTKLPLESSSRESVKPARSLIALNMRALTGLGSSSESMRGLVVYTDAAGVRRGIDVWFPLYFDPPVVNPPEKAPERAPENTPEKAPRR
jgi:DsbC/DsbD-like thiol-disulfide interchange protein